MSVPDLFCSIGGVFRCRGTSQLSSNKFVYGNQVKKKFIFMYLKLKMTSYNPRQPQVTSRALNRLEIHTALTGSFIRSLS